MNKYKVTTIVKPPFVVYDNVTNNYTGFCIDLLEKLSAAIKFQYEIREVGDGNYGSQRENGAWNGMIGELLDEKADIALGSLWVTAQRERAIDFTVPFYDLVGLSIMVQKPKTTESLFKFLTVLESQVWFCILGAYFLTSILLWIFDRWSPYSYRNNREKYKNDEEKREFDLRECFWFCMTSLTPQGGGEAPKNLSGRLVAATWWLFGFIIIASYTANLAAFLTVSRLETPIDSLEDLGRQYKIQYAPVIDSPAYVYFQRMARIEEKFYTIWKSMSLNDDMPVVQRSKLAVWDYPVSDKYTKIFHAMREAGFPKTLEEAVDRVRQKDSNHEFALVGDSATINYLVATNCDLKRIGEDFSRKPYAIAVRQGSPFKDQLNTAIIDLINDRTIDDLKKKWWNEDERRRNCKAEKDQSAGISVNNIGGVFIVIFLGIIFAYFTLMLEYWYYRRTTAIVKIHSQKVKATKIVEPIRFHLRPGLPRRGM